MIPYTQKLTLKQWADDDKPREKLATKGRQVLSNAELIAILIGSGNRDQTALEVSKDILAYANNDLWQLGKLSIKELSRFKGIGSVKAITLIAALELGRRRSEDPGTDKTKITCSKDAYKELAPFVSDHEQEVFWILALNRANYVEDKIMISSGGLTSTLADTRIIFKRAIDKLATSIILCHNHPSGNLQPSPEDIQLTKKLVSAGRILDIQVLDHLIIAGNNFYSFADNGLMV